MSIKDSLEKTYQKIFQKGAYALKYNRPYLDPYLIYPGAANDRRMGLTLLVTLDGEFLDQIHKIYQELQAIEPYQYFYPLSDLHVTIMDLIGAKTDYRYDRNQLIEYINILDNVIPLIESFEVEFKGLTVSDGAVLVKGYYGDGLHEIRKNIRRKAQKRKVRLEERYESVTAHATIVRFKDHFRRNMNFLRKIHELKDVHIATLKVKKIEFVMHDWYNLEHKKYLIKTYQLKDTKK